MLEQADEIGGGTRTAELTLPGFVHDICSAIHPLGVGSPFFRNLGLEVDWVHPDIPLAHPLGGGRVGVVERGLEATAARFGEDARRYQRLLGPLVQAADAVMEDYLGPMTRVPESPGSFVRLAGRGALPASIIASGFSSEEARGVLAGLAAHAIAPFSSPLTGGVALLFAVFQAKPSPFTILDEVDAALDEANVRRLIGLVRDFTDRTQFLIVTHAKTTMEAADVLYGVTMEEAGVSKKVGVRLTEYPAAETVAAG